MIKKLLLLTTTMMILLATNVFAEDLSLRDVLEKLPPLKQGVAFSMQDNALNYLSTVELAKWKFLNLEIGYAGRADNTRDKIVGVLSTDAVNFKKLGVQIPILELIDLNAGIYAGYGSINMQEIDRSEFDWGISCTILSVKF